jgi:hypothetical protein
VTRPARIGGRVAGCRGPREPARSTAVDPGPGGRLAVTELLARVGGSSVSLNCPCADQGGRHGDMVVGADRRGRCCVGVWCDSASGPLTGAAPAARSRLALLLDQADGLAVGLVGPGPAGVADHPVLPGPAGSCAQPGLGPSPRRHREQFVVGKAVSLAEQAKLFAGPVAASRGPPWRVSPRECRPG